MTGDVIHEPLLGRQIKHKLNTSFGSESGSLPKSLVCVMFIITFKYGALKNNTLQIKVIINYISTIGLATTSFDM